MKCDNCVHKDVCLYTSQFNEPSNSSPYIPDSRFTYVNAVSAESKSTFSNGGT